MANTIWSLPGNDVNLTFPYFPDVESVKEGARELAKRKEIGPELEAKLKESKAKVLAMRAANGG